MKINHLEVHDRLEQLSNQWDTITSGYVECMNHVPDDINFPIYIFAHPRTVSYDEKVSILQSGVTKTAPSTRLLWSPRATKPKAQTNSYLFLGQKGAPTVQIIWLLPDRSTWAQYAPGKITYHKDVWQCIQNFIHARDFLNKPDEGAPNPRQIEFFRRIYGEAAQQRKVEKEREKLMEGLYLN